MPGDRTDIEDGTSGIVNHERQASARHPQQAEHVGLHHELPILIPGLRDRFKAFRASGVVDKDVNAVGERPRPGDEVIHTFRLGNVQHPRLSRR